MTLKPPVLMASGPFGLAMGDEVLEPVDGALPPAPMLATVVLIGSASPSGKALGLCVPILI